MKHNKTITIILLAMFLLTQFIGLFVIYQYSPVTQTVLNNQTGQLQNVSITPDENKLPFGMQPPEDLQKSQGFVSFLISFIFAILLVFLLMKFELKIVIRIWFLVVVALALSVSFNAFLKIYLSNAWLIALLFAIPLAILKVFKPNVLLHNATELFIYPGIASIMVPIFIDGNFWLARVFHLSTQTISNFSSLLLIWPVIIFLILISLYDMWAVWRSEIMQKMAKYHMEEVKIFPGLMIPYMSKKIRLQMKKFKSRASKNRIKIQLAILGGGDLAFTLIPAGAVLRALGLVPALFVIFGGFTGLLFLLLKSEKKKFYPAMPFITAGIFIGLLVWALLF